MKNWFREVLIKLEIIQISREEKVRRIDERYKNDSSARYWKIMELYRDELDELKYHDDEVWYRRFVDICAEHKLDFPISCNGAC